MKASEAAGQGRQGRAPGRAGLAWLAESISVSLAGMMLTCLDAGGMELDVRETCWLAFIRLYTRFKHSYVLLTTLPLT